MKLFVAYPLAHVLGWTLIHFLWQGAAVALLLWCVLNAVGLQPSRLRYAAACVALALMVALPVITSLRLATESARLAELARESIHAADIVVAAGMEASVTPWPLRLSSTLERAMPALLMAWFLGVACFLSRLGFGLFATRALRASGTFVGGELQRLFDELRARLAISRPVELLHCARVQVPTVVGWLRPIVLLPASCFSGLAPEQIEAILCHELAHIVRHDYVVSVLQSIVETLFFYHPAVWWVSRQVRRERECCCDDFTVRAGINVLAYARALAVLEEQRAVCHQFALAANGGILKMRIQRLLGRPAISAASQFAATAVLALLIVSALGVAGRMAWAEARGAGPAVFAAKPVEQMVASQSKSGGAMPANEVAAATEKLGTYLEQIHNLQYQRVQLLRQADTLNRQETDYSTLLAQVQQQPTLSDEDRRQLEDAAKQLTANIDQWTEMMRQDMAGRAEAIARYNSPHFQKQMADAMARVNSPEFRKQLADAQSAIAKLNTDDMRREMALAQAGITQLDPNALAKQMETAKTAAAKIDVSKVLAQIQAGRGAVQLMNSSELRKQMEEAQRSTQIDSAALDKQLQQLGIQQKLYAQNSELPALEQPAQYGQPGAAQDPSGPVRVSAGVVQSLIVSQPPPVYPPIAKAAHVQGVVVLHAIISKNGSIQNLAVISGPPMLIQAAVDAVQKWTYRPYLINGQPVEVNTTIMVNFSFGPDLSCTYYDQQGSKHAGTCEEDDSSAGHYSCRADDDKALVQSQSSCEFKVKRTQEPQHSSSSPAIFHLNPANSGTPAAGNQASSSNGQGGNPVRKIGGDVTQPIVIRTAEPEYTEEARKAKFMGTVLVACIVDERGLPEDVHVVRGIGMGLNDKAVAAVKQYEFKPAMEHGVPVRVALNIEVNFQVF